MTARTDLKQAATALAARGQSPFSPAELIAEAGRRGSTYLETTLRTHIVSSMCVNAPGPSGGIYPDLERVGRGLYRLVGEPPREAPTRASVAASPRRLDHLGVPTTTRARGNTEALIAHFTNFLAAFEAEDVFQGPSRYFHLKALERRSVAPSPAALLQDERFLEYVYAVLPSWGMHRMGAQAAKVPAFDIFARALCACESQIENLWHRDITELAADKVDEVGEQLWEIIARLRSSTSGSRLVSGSKTLHHVLPALMPPIDREYTFRFFTGQTMLSRSEEASFLAWWPLLCEVGRRCAQDVRAATGRAQVMATSPSKVIDNAIIGFRIRQRAHGEP